MILRLAQPSESRGVRQWIMELHYTKTAPPGYVAALEFLEGRKLIGAMLLGRPTARMIDHHCVLELTRMVFLDKAPANTESRALAMMRRWVRTWHPQIKLLIAYSDPAVGHTGTVYAADNWAPFGLTRNGKIGWRTRPNRRAEVPSRKQRWVRSP